MKKLFLALLATVAASTVTSAQIYRPSVVGQSTVLGAVAGALIGGHNHDRWAEGAVIGAAAGAVLGAVVDDQRAAQPVVYTQPAFAPVATVPCAPMIGAPAQVTYVSPAPQQVVYVNAAPQRVVYVDPYPVYVSQPAVYIGATWGGYWGHGRSGHGYYGHGGYHHGGHRGHR
jgi:hypothetical protein